MSYLICLFEVYANDPRFLEGSVTSIDILDELIILIGTASSSLPSYNFGHACLGLWTQVRMDILDFFMVMSMIMYCTHKVVYEVDKGSKLIDI